MVMVMIGYSACLSCNSFQNEGLEEKLQKIGPIIAKIVRRDLAEDCKVHT